MLLKLCSVLLLPSWPGHSCKGYFVSLRGISWLNKFKIKKCNLLPESHVRVYLFYFLGMEKTKALIYNFFKYLSEFYFHLKQCAQLARENKTQLFIRHRKYNKTSSSYSLTLN